MFSCLFCLIVWIFYIIKVCKRFLFIFFTIMYHVSSSHFSTLRNVQTNVHKYADWNLVCIWYLCAGAVQQVWESLLCCAERKPSTGNSSKNTRSSFTMWDFMDDRVSYACQTCLYFILILSLIVLFVYFFLLVLLLIL